MYLWGHPIFLYFGMLAGALILVTGSLSITATYKRKPRLFKWHRRFGLATLLFACVHISMAILFWFFKIGT